MKMLPERFIVGATLLIAAELCFASLSGLVKFYSTELNQSQLVFFRNVFSLLVLLPLCTRNPIQKLATQHFKWHAARTITGLIAMYCLVHALATIKLAEATLVLMLSPFFIPFVARVWLDERIRLGAWLALIVGFFGVLVFLNVSTTPLNSAVFTALIAATFVAITKVMLRKMSSTESPFNIVFYFALLSTICSFPVALYYWQPFNHDIWLGILAMGFLASGGQWLMTKAFSVASPARIGLFGYTSIIFAGILGWLFWQEPFGQPQLFGTALIFLAGYVAIKNNNGIK